MTTIPTPEQRARWRELCQEAAIEPRHHYGRCPDNCTRRDCAPTPEWAAWNDAVEQLRRIHRTALPALLDEVERLEAGMGAPVQQYMCRECGDPCVDHTCRYCELKAENATLRKALEFYADEGNWNYRNALSRYQPFRAVADAGDRARKALAKEGNDEIL